jgi:hypothetical protein
METKPARTRVHRGFFPSLRPAWVALAAIVAVIVAGGGTVYAAGSALPDSPLYSIKLATESVRLFFTPSDIGKVELYAQFADERVEEIVKMAEKGEAELAQAATDRLNEQLVAMATLAIDGEGIATNGDMFALEAAESPQDGGAYTTIPAATMAPTTAPAPSLATATPPDSEKSPQLGAADITPAPVTAPEEALTAASNRQAYDEAKNSDRERKEKLKELLLQQAIENPEALLRALETAPESLRDILLWAIEVANAGYDEAIDNLE